MDGTLHSGSISGNRWLFSENAKYLWNTRTRTSCLFWPFLNKPNIIRNGRELSSVQYLLTKPENAEYLQNAETRTSRIFFPFKVHNNRFEQAQDHKKRWRIEQCRVSTYQTRKCGISPERGNAHLSSLFSL